MDAIEILWAVEERFGVSVRYEEAAGIVTVGDLNRLVLSRIAAREVHTHPTLRAFLALRADVREVMADKAFRIRPRQRIADVIPVRKRRKLWRKLRHRLGREPPALERPLAVKVAMGIVIATLFGYGSAFAAVDLAILPLSLICPAFLSVALLLVTRLLGVIPPQTMATFGDAARKIGGTTVAMNQAALPDPAAWVAEVVRDILVDILRVDRQLIVPEARLVEDLGMS